MFDILKGDDSPIYKIQFFALIFGNHELHSHIDIDGSLVTNDDWSSKWFFMEECGRVFFSKPKRHVATIMFRYMFNNLNTLFICCWKKVVIVWNICSLFLARSSSNDAVFLCFPLEVGGELSSWNYLRVQNITKDSVSKTPLVIWYCRRRYYLFILGIIVILPFTVGSVCLANNFTRCLSH